MTILYISNNTNEIYGRLGFVPSQIWEKKVSLYPITPHYRSEGRRQGSNGVFWGLYDTTYTLLACIFTLL